MEVSVEYEFLSKKPTVRAAEVMDHFGIGFETGKHVIADGLELSIKPGDVVCFVGDSGSGKSSLMRAVGSQLKDVANVDDLELGNEILVEGIGLDVSESLPMFSSCGLGEAQLLLRTPNELSDGQRYRFRLLKGIVEKTNWVLADEFTATLDRTLAKVIAFNVRRIANRNMKGFLLATTHEDVLEDLQPDVLVRCSIGEEPSIEYRDEASKKKNQLCPKIVDHRSDPSGLAVLCSMALSKPQARLCSLYDVALERRRADWDLCFYNTRKEFTAAVEVFWAKRKMVAVTVAGFE